MPVCARVLALALLLIGSVVSQHAMAQTVEAFTLTNGRLWWSNGQATDPDEDFRDPVAFDASRSDADGNWLEVHPHGSDHVTHITAQGAIYLALDTNNYEHPVSKTHAQFDRLCVWYRTGYTGYYYQEWYSYADQTTYRYYLVGSSDLFNDPEYKGLKIVRSEVGQALEQSTYWYNWDFGAAAWEKPVINGEQKNRYYWVTYDNIDDEFCEEETSPVWRLSAHSYQRPEDIYYESYIEGDDAGNAARRHYYNEVTCSGVHYPASNGALFMPVNIKAHEDSILSIEIISTDPSSEDYNKPYGLQKTVDGTNHTLGTGISITDANGDPVSTLVYDPDATVSATLTANMKYKNGSKVPMTVMPAYTTYVEETYRRGIHLDYRQRNQEGVFGSAGEGTFRTHYYWKDPNYPTDRTHDLHYDDPSTSTVNEGMPTPRADEEVTAESITFSVDNRSRRYLEITADATNPNKATLTFDSPTQGEVNVSVYVRVRYSNGSEQRDTTTLKLKYEKPAGEFKTVNGPVVRGAVYGGGRMANVGGGTAVIIHSADSIQSLYGGNDIAGWVQGESGANIQIGTEFTGEDENGKIHHIHIGSVYGGGNGYYTYQGINSGVAYTTHTDGTIDTNYVNPYFQNQSTSLIYQAYYFNGKVYPWNTLPAGYLENNEAADQMNKNQAVWAGFTPVVEQDFNYTPFYIGRPDMVDQAETGDDGNGTIPYIKTAHITVGVPEADGTPFLCEDGDPTYEYNDHILIDTLFGGARNAFIGVDANENENRKNGVSIDINGGTLYAVFGGNNVGGSVANKSTVFVNVHDTKLIGADEEYDNTWLAGYGRDFGIRYLFGGGNLVDGSHANVTISGGLLDTVYLGGNKATVKEPIGTVDCPLGDASSNTHGYTGHVICTNPTYPDRSQFPGNDPKQADAAYMDQFGPYGTTHPLVPEDGKYNINCLFGGNNAADMDNLTTIMLHSGGISTVYGGGNLGDMTNDKLFNVTKGLVVNNVETTLGTGEDRLFPDAQYNYLFDRAFDIDPTTGGLLNGGWASVYGKRTLPNKVGTIVTALPNSKIVCDYVFGGSRMGNVKNSCGVYLAGGTFGYVNGGNDVSGDVGSETGGGTYLVLDSNVLVVGYAVAGSDGYYHCESTDNPGHYDDNELYDTYEREDDAVSYDPYDDYVGMLFPTHNNVNLYMRGGLVLGQLLGGGTHADVGFPDLHRKIYYGQINPETGSRQEKTISLDVVGGEKRGTVHLMATGGHVKGEVFGGGYQSNIHGLAYLTLGGKIKIDGSFYTGNDCTGSIQSFGSYMNSNDWEAALAALAPQVEAGTLTPEQADRQARQTAYDAMEASDGTKLNSDDGANYSAYLRIEGTPRIGCVYGGGNGAYNYANENNTYPDRPEYEKVSYCSPNSEGEEVRPYQSSSFIDIHTTGPHSYSERGHMPLGIDTVFGGGNGIGVRDEVVVLLNNTSSDLDKQSVHTIFGGNNRDNMAIVPQIRLKKGVVSTVFGGANNGVMSGSENDIVDILGNPVTGVSTHVVLESDEVTVRDTIFGGNRMSDVRGLSYVEVRNTTTNGSIVGVNYIFGGNDISGSIEGGTRVDVSGGYVRNLFGGSDGRYDFVEVGDNQFRIYPFEFVKTHPTWFDGHTVLSPADSAELEHALITIAARPDVDNTTVNLWGGTVGSTDEYGGVYGGGSMASCRVTNIVVNDTVSKADGTHFDGNLTIYGAVYGGGMGNFEDLNARSQNGSRYGNVDEATYVDLYHASAITTAKAYGGGRGGDVMNTYITTHSGWDTPFDQLYGGCWGSDVFGTAHLEFSGIDLVHNLFGGNDFAGDVYKAEIKVHSGRFYNVFGAGNGDYPDDAYNTGTYADDPTNSIYRHISRPNVEYVNVTFDNGTVEGNLFGGGKLGTTWAYKKDPATQEYIVDAYNYKIPDTNLNVSQAHSDPQDYSYIITNIHGGNFYNNVFGGASGRGSTNTKALVYGLKEVNMDGGYIHMSLYGGSESVNDGYAAECISTSTTTKRPSSIVNLTGGTVESNLYGAGYLGTTYGSVYVNVGHDAIDSCVAYSEVFAPNSDDSLYLKFKPGREGSLAPTLGKTNIALNHSIYAGANWGAGTGQATFNMAGFIGGESMIHIDGKGYNTGVDELSSLPQMNVKKSLFGSGTSVKGGDVRSHIDLWNYGEMELCHPTKELESVQRADQFFSHNTAVHYLGATDATSAYISEPYSMLRLTDVVFRGFNVAEYDAAVNKIWQLYFYEEDLNSQNKLELVPIQTLRAVPTSDAACGLNATICGKTEVVSPTNVDRKHTLLLLNNGIDFNVQEEQNGVITGGSVKGFGYVATPVGYSSSIIAYPTAVYYPGDGDWQAGYYSYEDYAEDWTDGYSGFASPCDTTNKYAPDRSLLTSGWLDSDDEGYVSSDAEFPYTNYLNEAVGYLNYREWKIGTGVRLRETAIRAHANPNSLPEEDVNVMIGNKDLALAKASVTLPATSTGHYYRLNNTGILISGSSSAVNLVDETWQPSVDFDTLRDAYGDPDGSAHTDVSNMGVWRSTTLETGGLPTGADQIVTHPDNTFGMLMIPGQHFQTDGTGYVMPDGETEDKANLVLSGNAYYNASAYYCSPKVVDGDRIMPTMDFLLTYNPNFATTFLGTVEFTLDEYDANNNLVGPVKVRAYLSTIIEQFRTIETNVLAMFNNGVIDEFTRRIILPITLDENRELYVRSIRWEPTDGIGVTDESSEKFYLAEDSDDIKNATPHSKNNLFGLHVIPNDAVTGDLNENLGWSVIDKPDINLFTLARPTGSDPKKYAADGNETVFLTDGNQHGQRIGILDGRGTAALNVKLLFDGSRTYPKNEDNGYLGKAVLGMRWVKGEQKGDFYITIYVKTRDHGDTIYLASADEVSRNGYTVRPYSDYNSYFNILSRSSDDDSVALAPTVIGKSPNCYVQSFQHALSSNVYQEGDVIAIIDQVNINDRPVHIQGADGPPIEVIRYAGHHHELPSDTGGVYRGPMIVVSDENNKGILFTAQNIDFHGSAGALVKRVLRDATGNPILDSQGNLQFATSFTYGGQTWTKPAGAKDMKMPDTNRAFGPIIMVKNNGAVMLSEGTRVRHNWNAYGHEENEHDATGLTLHPELMGAISVTSGGTLTLKGDVSVSDNLCHTIPLDLEGDEHYDALRPGNGAIYVDGGHVVLPQSHKNTAVDITRNRLMSPEIHNPGGTTWWNLAFIDNRPSRFTLDEDVVSTWKKANLYLTRTAPTTGTDYERDLQDVQSDIIQLTGALGNNTRIGVRKWFPGAETRDTIRFAVNTSADYTVMDRVLQNENFQSDDGYRIFYNQEVNNVTAYLFRCATFKHQMNGVNLPIAGSYYGKDVLHYGILESNTCPTGGDTIIYRIQGGFAPYKYTWELKNGSSYETIREFTSPYPNTYVTSEVNHGNVNPYLSSISDTLLTPAIAVPPTTNETAGDVRVEAVDATGVCRLYKNIKVNIFKMGDTLDIPEYPAASGLHPKWQVAQVYHDDDPSTYLCDGWADTSRLTVAKGNRYYRSVKITPWIWTDASQGTISAIVLGGDDIILRENEDGTRHELEDLLFCEGDVIRLRTHPTYNGAEFLMWNFDPFNENPATYVVPSHDDDVIAYYGSRYHWSDTIDTPAEAGVVNSESYYYTQRPDAPSPYNLFNTREDPVTCNKAGYVTTYNGDVHIYNENGLAWFISTVNGLNGYQARPFHSNSVYLHKKDALNTPYDMSKFLWSPVGSRQYGFSGRLVGVGAGDADTTALSDGERVIIKNIVLNEPYMDFVGFFGLLESAECTGVGLQDIFVRGGQYVGGFAAQANNTTIDNCAIVSNPEKALNDVTTSIITTNYASGGMVGSATGSTIVNSTIDAKYTGNAVYNGGVAGVNESVVITDNEVYVDGYSSGVYSGGIAASTDGTTDESCISNVSAELIEGEPTETSDYGDGQQIRVSWQSRASYVYVGICAGDNWSGVQTADGSNDPDDVSDMIRVRGNSGSYTFELPRTPDGLLASVYTVAVKAQCVDGGPYEGESKTVWITPDDPDAPCCITYSLESTSLDGNTLYLRWTGVSGQCQNPGYDTIKVGYCIGTAWDSTNLADVSQPMIYSALIEDYQEQQMEFNLGETLSTAYVVGLYSCCSGTWTTDAVTGEPPIIMDCPNYEVMASYNNGSADGAAGATGATPSITLSWTTSNLSADAPDSVSLGICAGTEWLEDYFTIQNYPGVGNNTSTEAMGNSYTFGNLPELTDNENTYTLALRSNCSEREWSIRVNTYGDIVGSLGPWADNVSRGHTSARKSGTNGRSVIANNYVRITGKNRTMRMGGLVGRSSNTDIMNNYVYGTVAGNETGGSVVAVMDRGTRAVDNFAAHGTADRNVGRQLGGMVSNTAGFEGSGNHVILDQRVYGIDNLTLALNRWVRERNGNGAHHKTWRSDLEGVNSGYPVFGRPDMITVVSDKVYDGCGEVILDGIRYTHDTVVATRVVDYDMMVDSTIRAIVQVHNGTHTFVTDEVAEGDDYEGYGFSISGDELRMLARTLGTEGHASIILNDTLTSTYGCDSIVTLTLAFYLMPGTEDIPEVEEVATTVNVYPNPTKGVVNVEAENMSHVEVYDNEGRRLQDYNAYGSNKITIDMTTYVSGVYFVRVHSPQGVVIQKVIKER